MAIESVDALVAALTESLGEEQARAIVRREAAALGLGSHLTNAESLRLLRQIEALSGPAGLAARLLVVRLQRTRMSGLMARTTPDPNSPQAPASHTPVIETDGTRVPVSELAGLFAKSLGEPVAEELVKKAMARLGIAGDALTRKEAEAILDNIEALGGVAAAVARFAKVRFLLRFA